MTNTIRPMRFMGRQFSTPFLMLGVSGLLVATPTLAQTDVGLKGGLNLSSFYGENIGEATTRQGHIFGAFLNTGLWGPFSVQPEAYYSRRGATGGDIHTETLGDVTNWLWNYNYLDFVPVLKLRVTPGGWSPTLSVFAGPIVSFLVGAKATGTKSKAQVPPYEGAFPYVSPLNYNTKGNDFGGTAGVDLSFNIGPTKVYLDARYTRMMTTFDETSDLAEAIATAFGTYSDSFSRKHNSLSFQIGMSLTPNAWRGGRVRRRRAAVAPRLPPVNTIVLIERITREDISARPDDSSVYDLIRLERPAWLDGDSETVRGTLFLDGQLWAGSSEMIKDRRGAEVEEIRRLVRAPGVYREHAVVIEIISRRGAGV